MCCRDATALEVLHKNHYVSFFYDLHKTSPSEIEKEFGVCYGTIVGLTDTHSIHVQVQVQVQVRPQQDLHMALFWWHQRQDPDQGTRRTRRTRRTRLRRFTLPDVGYVDLPYPT